MTHNNDSAGNRERLVPYDPELPDSFSLSMAISSCISFSVRSLRVAFRFCCGPTPSTPGQCRRAHGAAAECRLIGRSVAGDDAYRIEHGGYFCFLLHEAWAAQACVHLIPVAGCGPRDHDRDRLGSA